MATRFPEPDPPGPGLYLHVPFCLRQCQYCGFYVEPLGSGPLAARKAAIASIRQPDFLDAIERELQQLPPDFVPATVYLGGGTPTELAPPDLERLLQRLHRYIDLSSVVEWTCEANPGTLTPDTIDLLQHHGITRVSLGVQSFQPEVLSFLTRIHSADEARAAFHALRQADFDAVSIDLMFGLPRTTTATVAADLAELITLNPDHTTTYALDIEPHAPLAAMLASGAIQPLDDATAAEQYHTIRTQLTRADYHHYELFAFARPGFACQHHLNYWASGAYIGIGPSAHSHWRGERYRNHPDLHRYQHALLSGTSPQIDHERLAPEAKAREALITSLRQRRGVHLPSFTQRHGFNPLQHCRSEIDQLRAEGLLEHHHDHLRLTDAALFISDTVFRHFV